MAKRKSSKIDETLRQLASDMPSGNLPSTETSIPASAKGLAGDPNCPICHGIGYFRRDLPMEHPDFGKVQVCTCRHAEISQQVHQRLFALSKLDNLSHLTFENFNPRGQFGLRPFQADSLEAAYNHARQFAQNLNGWLLLLGGCGCGKTHLAAAIANFAVSIGVPTLFITVPDMLDSLRFAYEDPQTSFEERFDEIRQAPLLVLDDFGTQNFTPWAQEKLFQVLNYRYINRLPLVITTNVTLDAIEERIRSRLEDPELVSRVMIYAPDYRKPTQDRGYYDLSSLYLYPKCTFANFDLRKGEGLTPEQMKSLENALEAAQRYAENPQGWIVFAGPYGCGKTHLAAAIGNYRDNLGAPTYFVTTPDLLDHLRATFNPSSTVSLDRRFEEVRTAPLLILDDLGTQASSHWTREKLYQLFNYRYNRELPTVITTTLFKEEIDARILSRMEDTRLCTIYVISAPSYRGKAGPPTRSTRGKRTRY